MWQTIVLVIALVIAVYLVVHASFKFIVDVIAWSKEGGELNFRFHSLFIIIGLSYIIWYCN